MPEAGDRKEVGVMFPDDVQDFLDRHREGAYLLLDVRQPFEYEQAHLPGARLISLPNLPDSLDQFDPEKPTIVYCAVGGRSRTAAQFLVHRGFKEVYHLLGGIEAWTEPTASGPTEFHLQFIRGDESPLEIIVLGCRFEEALGGFHQAVKNLTSDRDLTELLTALVKAEASHKQTLMDLLPSTDREAFAREMSRTEEQSVMEGGYGVDDFMDRNKPYLQDVPGYLELAMMVETQALDLYLRMADVSRHPGTREILLKISAEEKGHLAALGRFLEEKSG